LVDEYEIANVLGIDGIEFMVDNSAHVPFCFIFGAPSYVLVTPFETMGASITVEGIDKLLQNDKISYLLLLRSDTPNPIKH